MHLEIILEDGSPLCTVEIMENSSLEDVRDTLAHMAKDNFGQMGIPKNDSYLFVIDGDVIPRDQESVEDAVTLQPSVHLRVEKRSAISVSERGPFGGVTEYAPTLTW